MKVLYICADWGIPITGFKGASVHVREFVNSLNRLGHEVVLVFANRGEGNPDPRATLIEMPVAQGRAGRSHEADRLGIQTLKHDKLLCRELDKIAYDRLFAARVLKKLLELGFHPDVVYERFALFHRAGVDLSKTLGVPYVVEVNAPLIDEQERHRGLRLRSAAMDAQIDCLGRADRIITVSDALKTYVVAQGISVDRVTCLPNGVDTSRFSPDVDGSAVRSHFEIHDRRVIGFIGSLKPWHGLEFLFDAFSLVASAHDDHCLLLVGDGPGFAYAKERAENIQGRGRVILTGGVPHDQIPAYLAAMDMTVAPYEASDHFYFSPLKVIESLAAGRPVVAPRLGQLSDLIQDGITGLLYEPADLQGCARNIRLLLSDSEKCVAMKKNARKFAVTHLSWERVAQSAVEIMLAASRAT